MNDGIVRLKVQYKDGYVSIGRDLMGGLATWTAFSRAWHSPFPGEFQHACNLAMSCSSMAEFVELEKALRKQDGRTCPAIICSFLVS